MALCIRTVFLREYGGATANQDQTQLELSQKFLQDKQLTVDIFAISPAGNEIPAPTASKMGRPELSTRLQW